MGGLRPILPIVGRRDPGVLPGPAETRGRGHISEKCEGYDDLGNQKRMEVVLSSEVGRNDLEHSVEAERLRR